MQVQIDWLVFKPCLHAHTRVRRGCRAQPGSAGCFLLGEHRASTEPVKAAWGLGTCRWHPLPGELPREGHCEQTKSAGSLRNAYLQGDCHCMGRCCFSRHCCPRIRCSFGSVPRVKAATHRQLEIRCCGGVFQLDEIVECHEKHCFVCLRAVSFLTLFWALVCAQNRLFSR